MWNTCRGQRWTSQYILPSILHIEFEVRSLYLILELVVLAKLADVSSRTCLSPPPQCWVIDPTCVAALSFNEAAGGANSSLSSGLHSKGFTRWAPAPAHFSLLASIFPILFSDFSWPPALWFLILILVC